MVSMVNGYVCFSSCDEAKARQGKDPRPSDSTVSGVTNPAKISSFDQQPATILDGGLRVLGNSANLTVAAVEAGAAAQHPTVNILV